MISSGSQSPYAAAFAVALLLPIAAHAQDTPRDSVTLPRAALGDTVLLLPEVRVDRDRPLSRARALQPTGFVAELDARARARTVSAPALALDQAAGVRVIQYGGLGAFSTVTMRGAPASHVAVLVDGEPLQSAARTVASLADLPATAIERVEVWRGAAPLELGAPPAGAVNFVTLPGDDAMELHVARGSFGTWEARGRAAGATGPLAFGLNAGWQESRGDFAYLDDYGTPLNAADDTTRARANNRHESAHAVARLGWTPAPGFDVRLRASASRRRGGYAGSANLRPRETRQSHERATARVAVTRGARGAWPLVELDGGLARERTRFADPRGELGLGRVDARHRFDGEDLGALLAWGATSGPASLRASAGVRAERAAPSEQADTRPDPPESRRDARHLALSAHLRPWIERLQLHGALRWDALDDRLHAIGLAGSVANRAADRALRTPQLGARFALLRDVELRANWTDARRAPDFTELFGDRGGVIGNPDLVPERSRTWDAGVVAQAWLGARARASLEYAHFETRADQLIQYRRSTASVKAFNVARARIGGDEVTATVGPVAGLTAHAAWTRQRAIDDGTWAPWTGKRLAGRPDSRLYARLSGAWGAWAAHADVDAIGENWLDPSNRTRVAPRALFGAGLSWAVTSVVGLSLEGRNLGDERASDVAGYPLPGRAVFAACAARWARGASP